MAFHITQLGWEPFRQFTALQEEFWAPATDVEETKEEVIIKVEIPGLKREDIKVHVQDDTLVITGERTQESEIKDKTVHRIERVYGKFQRLLELPAEVAAGTARATYENGILEIHLPKAEQAKPTEISIEVR